jgi:hypothetical protein
LVAAALLAWPQPTLVASKDALAAVEFPGFAGQIANVEVRSATGARVPVQMRGESLWPLDMLDAGERLTVVLTVHRPAWASWLVGQDRSSQYALQTPSAQLRQTWVEAKSGSSASVVFDMPVERVAFGESRAQHLTTPQTVVSIGALTRGAKSAGTIKVAAAARSWERLSAPIVVAWFVPRSYPQVLVGPSTTTTLVPAGQLTFTFSAPLKAILGGARPKLTPAVPGRWQVVDEHTLAFQPSGLGFGLGATVHAELPVAAHLAEQPGSKLTRTVQWQVASGSALRLDQLLAQLGYLPLSFESTSQVVTDSPTAQLAAALSPPAGEFSWRYPNTPAELRALWHVGRSNTIVYGAVMMFEDTHGMPADGVAGPTVWAALIRDVVAGKSHDGYSYVFVHRNEPQLLTLWHNGRVVLTSPGNTGVPEAPTQLGTFPVFEHIRVGTMSGTNPDGSHYKDPGIRWVSYFNHGEALHSFNRASFGTPQSLGCVELPLAAAAKVWPYTPIGTLVTIEN